MHRRNTLLTTPVLITLVPTGLETNMPLRVERRLVSTGVHFGSALVGDNDRDGRDDEEDVRNDADDEREEHSDTFRRGLIMFLVISAN